MRDSRFSIKDNLMIFMLLVLFGFRFIPEKIQVIVMAITVIITLYCAFRLKTKNYSIGVVLMLILLAMTILVMLIVELIKIRFNQYNVYETYLMILCGLLFSSAMLIIFIIAFKRGGKKNIKKLILASVGLIIPIIMFFYLCLSEILK